MVFIPHFQRSIIYDVIPGSLAQASAFRAFGA